MTEEQGPEEDLAEVIDLEPIDQFRHLVAILDDGIVVLDRAGKVRFVNPAAERLLGRRGRDLVGRDFGVPLVSDESTELRIVRRDDERVVVELRTAEIDWDGEAGVVATLRDVSERTRVIDSQHQTIEQLQELDALRNEFVSMVSHDLRSPMATISGFADTLRNNWDAFDDEHKIRILDRISRRTVELASLVENILQVSQIEAGKLDYKLRDVDLAALIARVADENAATDGDPTASSAIEIEMPHDLPPVRADETRQWQILSNLVTNALKFSPPGRPVRIGAAVDDGHVRVTVSDEGPGIHPDDVGKLFQKFSRLEQPPGFEVKGSGLGLYICKAMVDAQGGRIWIEPGGSGGATFAYTIPIAA